MLGYSDAAVMTGEIMQLNSYTLMVPGKPVVSLNSYLRSHWSVRNRAKQAWIKQVFDAAIAYVAAQQAQGQMIYLHDLLAMGQPRRVRLEYYFPDSRRRDVDNYFKIMLDCLVHNGLLADDSPRYCQAEAVILTDRENPRTEIHIENVGSEGE